MVEKKKIEKIGVLTSGGDSPGMNACIRAVVRAAVHRGIEVVGIKRGYQGLLEEDMAPMDFKSVSGIIQRGGTVLKTARSEEFRTKRGLRKAALILDKLGIDALVVVGGDGSFRGAYQLSKISDIAVIGVPASIDNDVYGTDFSIGYDSAINTALESVDKIRDTAESHDRIFFVEVMGRDTGFIAVDVGLAGGAEEVLIPESKTRAASVIAKIKKGIEKGKRSYIVVVSEGDDAGGAFAIANKVKKAIAMDVRVCILGHVQRGGSPTASDRILASRLGLAAVDMVLEGKSDIAVGLVQGKVKAVPISETWKHRNKLDRSLLRAIKVLAF